jgi:hypothetical protein
MNKTELKAAVKALGLTIAQTAEKLGITESWLKKMLSEKSEKQVSQRIAGKVKQMIAEIPRYPAWERCLRCGGRMRLMPSKHGGGVAVIHRCPAVDGVIVKTTIEPMGAPAEQVKAALGRRAGKQNGGNRCKS